jgi:histidinol-phosphatase (PHP family)
VTLKDLHAHSTYCDGKNTPEEMIEAAIRRGMKTFGISGHSYTAFDPSWCMQKEDVPRYLAEMRYLRAKYFDRIHVLCGVEQDYYSEYPTDGFDYVIGSVHYLCVDGEYIPADESPELLRRACEKHFGGDIYALCEAYFATAADVVNKTGCDIIGHFDLIAKFNEKEQLFDESHPRYIAAWKRAADELLRADVPFEVNTGAISRGYRSVPYPSPDIIAYIKERGGRFVLSSDAHSVDEIGYRFDDYKSYVE